MELSVWSGLKRKESTQVEWFGIAGYLDLYKRLLIEGYPLQSHDNKMQKVCFKFCIIGLNVV